MALPTITLDDRTFEQLFALMRRQIDTTEWLDHNYSDAGIVLLDLLCWVGEMILYGADRVPLAHIEKFAALILDPPEPVTVPLKLTATTPAAAVVLPAGRRFATDFLPATSTRPAHRFVFETIVPVTFPGPTLPPVLEETVVVTARELLVVENEALGTSDGSADQAFPLRPVHADLGLLPDQPTPVLTDFVHRSASYDPNPQVTVGGIAWELKRFLLTEESYTGPSGALSRPHYMFDADGQIRFGDGVFGSMPPSGAAIACTRYQLLQGPDALIGADRLVHELDPLAGLNITAIKNGAAEGADFFFKPEERIREGLKRFRRPYRLITASDFQEVLRVDFNEYQARAGAPERVLRAIALMNRKPSAPDEPAPGHVTVVVLAPDATLDLDEILTRPEAFFPGQTAASHLAQKQALVDPSPVLVDKLQRFLDQRRLITTRVHLASPPPTSLPKLMPVGIDAAVMVDHDRSTADMAALIVGELRAFLGVTRGGFDQKGWPLGGNVYRSKIFRLLEDIDGVDHVEALTLSPADANGDVALEPLALPAVALNGLTVNVLRA